jgi:hypothetical protein
LRSPAQLGVLSILKSFLGSFRVLIGRLSLPAPGSSWMDWSHV